MNVWTTKYPQAPMAWRQILLLFSGICRRAIATAPIARGKHFEGLAHAQCRNPMQSWHACVAFDAAKMSRVGKSVPKRKLFLVVSCRSRAGEGSTDKKMPAASLRRALDRNSKENQAASADFASVIS
jgi:hypothetical protein